MKRDNFAGRYIVKLSSSIVLTVINAVIQLFLPRALSVEGYGFYSYNLNVFTSVVVMANLSASNAMVSKFSRKNEERGIIKFYLEYVALISVILNIAVFVLGKIQGSEGLFQGQTIYLVLLGLNAAVFNKLLTDVISMYDAAAISRFPAVIQILLKSAICVLVCAGYFLGTLDLQLFYVVQISITAVSIFILCKVFWRDHKKTYPTSTSKSVKEYISSFWVFCKPLILVSCFAQLNVIIMNWALMNYAGERQQAMFGVALQINILLSYVFSPYAELLKREFAVIAHDIEQVKFKFIQSLRQMFWITSYFAVFIIICADWLIPLLFGEEYRGAVLPTQLMMVYTIYQAWGQVTGSFLLSTEKTKSYAALTYIGIALTLAFIFLFQVPNFIFPNGLGAEGVALNYTLCNLIATTIMVSFCMKSLSQKLFTGWKIQFGALAESLLVAAAAKALVALLCGTVPALNILFVKVMLSGIIYTAGILAIVFKFPEQMGISKETLKNKLRKVFHRE